MYFHLLASTKNCGIFLFLYLAVTAFLIVNRDFVCFFFYRMKYVNQIKCIFQFTNDTYPVIVYIHSGDFQSGSSSDYPQDAILNNFVARKVVFISMNYRLGPLGKRLFSSKKINVSLLFQLVYFLQSDRELIFLIRTNIT